VTRLISWLLVMVAVACDGTPRLDRRESRSAPPPLTADASPADPQFTAWPNVDCDTIVTIEDVDKACRRRRGLALLAENGEGVVMSNPLNLYRTLCLRRIQLNADKSHVIALSIEGYPTSDVIDRLLPELGPRDPATPTGFLTRQVGARYSRRDLTGAKARVIYRLFGWNSSQPCCFVAYGPDAGKDVDVLGYSSIARVPASSSS